MIHPEKHFNLAGVYMKDFIYGANDGIITTFAIVSGASGAGFPPLVVIVLGFANLLADGFSMAASNYLGSSSAEALYKEEERREIREVEEKPEAEKEEVRVVFKKYNFGEDDSESLIGLIARNKKFWVDFMMRYELEMLPGESSIKAAVVTFLAFVFIGSLPLLPFVFTTLNSDTVLYSVASTGIALFVTGSLRSIFTKRHWFFSGLEMFLIGGASAAVSYLVGYGLSLLAG